MELIPIHTPVVRSGDDLASILATHASIHDGDIIVVSSKAIATAEGAAMRLDDVDVSREAEMWNDKTGCGPRFMQCVLEETTRLNGTIVGHCRGALLTEVQPDGLKRGTIFAPNAGMDLSNAGKGYAVGWPHDPVASVKHILAGLQHNCAVIISDSSCHPRRLGVTAIALTIAGMDGFKSEIGQPDLFGRAMRLTVESVADQLATAANLVMGNAAQSIPAVIIRNHAIPFSDYCGWVEGIEPEEDLFRSVL